ncbi:superkiller protein 3, partial [Lecanoromycetidae sp. Uapishka_2]
MSSAKATLKAAKAALDAHKYDDAVEQAKTVLATDPSNYNANVFIGLAYDKQEQYEASETAYKVAVKSKNKDLLAWQGLVTLYERQAGKKLNEYHDAVLSLAEIYMEKDDRTRCQTVISKYVADAKKYGSRAQLKRSLDVYLPGRPLHDFLEGSIPQPASTYAKIADIVEAEEKEKINTEIGQRRTRLGAKIDQVTADVKREVLEASQLEELYGAIIDWTHDDEIRRQYEEKLLQRAYDTLAILSSPKKATKREQVKTLAEGLVILKHPFLLAWQIKLEWSDVEEIVELDAGLLKEYIEFFQDDGLSKVLRGYLQSDISPFSKLVTSDEGESKDNEVIESMSAEDRLILMTEGIEESTSSILAHRLMGQLYLNLDENESAAAMARKGLICVSKESHISGLSLRNHLDAVTVMLATALVHFQAPRHHPEATELFEGILKRKPTETSALIGIGLILEEEEEYTKAVDFFGKALKRSSDPRIKAEAAWCKAMIGDNESGLHEIEVCLQEMEGSDLRTRSLRSQTLYRIGICIWNQDTSNKARKSKDKNGAYSYFLASMQVDMNYAPAYTSMGIYYSDYARDKKRARKCFQKAFELSSAEVEAAERLAKSFANSREWDYVEVVAQRVIESGKAKQAPGSKKKAVSWPFAALGVVQLNNQEYANSIVSFQAALRTTPTDYHCWVGLGEGYHNSGRYFAATKAFEQAQKLGVTSKDGSIKADWFSEYMLANVRKELGDYDDAIAGYQEVLRARPAEFGVSIALLQCLVEYAWHNVQLGFFGRAADTAREAISLAPKIVEERSDAFNLWKAIGDACSIFTYVEAHADRLPVEDLQSLFEIGSDADVYNPLTDIDGVDIDNLKTSLKEINLPSGFSKLSIRAALLAQKRSIHACAADIHARAVAWYNLGWTEHRAHVCQAPEGKAASGKRALRHLKASYQAFKRAIELESGNAEYWNSLGIATTDLNPSISQHSFIRSLYLNDKSARVWTNLGTLYLIQEDYQLASEAFNRAQSCDPDYAQAWLGQGLLANRLAESKEARGLFTHAFEIADSSSTMIKRQYAMSTFDHLISSPTSPSTADVLQPLFALHQLRSQLASDIVFQHLLSLFAERAGDFADAAANLEQIASTLEAEYETSESSITLLQYAQAKADLARVQLAENNLDVAADSAETALNLTDGGNSEKGTRRKIRLSAHMTAGLAYYYRGTMDEAISMFRSALEETQGNPDLVCLLAQVLWAKGGDDERSVAREQLFNCVETHPDHVGAIMLLSVIAILDDDRDTVEAVTADLQGLRTRDDLSVEQQSKVAQVLTAIASVYSDDDEDSSQLVEASTTVMLAPFKPHGWSQFAGFSEEAYPAEIAVLTATKAAPPRGTLDAIELAKAYAGTSRLDDAQRAVAMAPWTAQGWEALI